MNHLGTFSFSYLTLYFLKTEFGNYRLLLSQHLLYTSSFSDQIKKYGLHDEFFDTIYYIYCHIYDNACLELIKYSFVYCSLSNKKKSNITSNENKSFLSSLDHSYISKMSDGTISKCLQLIYDMFFSKSITAPSDNVDTSLAPLLTVLSKSMKQPWIDLYK